METLFKGFFTSRKLLICKIEPSANSNRIVGYILNTPKKIHPTAIICRIINMGYMPPGVPL